jgi:nitroreductase
MGKPQSDAKLFEVLYGCRAMRRFKPDPVPDAVLLQLVDAAIHAPSSSNAQNWRFVIVRDRLLKARIAEEWRKGWGWYKEIVATATLRPGEDEAARKRSVQAGDYMVGNLVDTPAVIFACIRRDEAVAKALSSPSTVTAAVRHLGLAGTLRLLGGAGRAQMTGIDSTAYPAVQNLLLAARALGLGAVLTTPHLFSPGVYERILGLPKDVTLTAVIPVGYPLGRFGPVRRPSPETVVSWDRYSS